MLDSATGTDPLTRLREQTPARLARVFGHAPGVGAVAAALGRQVLHGLQEGGQIGLGDAVLDLHHHRAPVVRHRLGQQRLGPMVRGL